MTTTTLSPDRVIRTTCPYCGVGCQMDLSIKDDTIYRVDAPFNSAPNYGNLCVKGRYGIDYVNHPRRLTAPLIRTDRRGEFREATWDEALALASERLVRIVQESGGDSVAT
jgi:predicted molibdopterin-dependent oxidoreductase YjgC